MGHIICEKKECTGCSVCASACPRNAVRIVKDEYGFYRPEVEESRCIGCNICNRTCPINNAPDTYGPTKTYAYQNTSDVRFNSTSGGFFNAVACKVIDEGGVVCGAAFDENMVLRHIIVERKEDLEPLQRSKYVQSSTDGIYKEIKEYLKNGRKVFFAGVGCQAAALRNYVGDDENLIIADLVCYGIPSSGLFNDWINYLQKKYGKVKDVRFRDKTYGYATPNVKVVFGNGKHIESCRDSSLYTDFFFRHLSIRESCFSCQFKTVDRASDITLGDLWVIGKYDKASDDNKGTTVVFAHTQKGIEICEKLCSIRLKTEEIAEKHSGKLTKRVPYSPSREKFWNSYTENDFMDLINIWNPQTLQSRIKYAIKRIANYVGVSRMIYRNRKSQKA